jgi:ribosomal protein S18 acetylase RimI-like enzyme
VELLDGWELRISPPVASRRVNSVWPRRDGERMPLEERLGRVEEAYAARGLPARFQLGPAAVPRTLDGLLARRGYRVEAPTLVQTAAVAEVVRRTPEPPGWVSAWGRADGPGGAEALLRAVRAPSAYAVLAEDGRTLAVGRAVLDGGWLGVFDVATIPERRRRGAGRAVLGALARWGLAGGARAAYLQVERENTAARALWTALGFATGYRYHYRTAGPQSRDSHATSAAATSASSSPSPPASATQRAASLGSRSSGSTPGWASRSATASASARSDGPPTPATRG